MIKKKLKRASFMDLPRFVETLYKPDLTPNLPKSIRQAALSALKHYPFDCELETLMERAEDIFGEKKVESQRKIYSDVFIKRVHNDGGFCTKCDKPFIGKSNVCYNCQTKKCRECGRNFKKGVRVCTDCMRKRKE